MRPRSCSAAACASASRPDCTSTSSACASSREAISSRRSAARWASSGMPSPARAPTSAARDVADDAADEHRGDGDEPAPGRPVDRERDLARDDEGRYLAETAWARSARRSSPDTVAITTAAEVRVTAWMSSVNCVAMAAIAIVTAAQTRSWTPCTDSVVATVTAAQRGYAPQRVVGGTASSLVRVVAVDDRCGRDAVQREGHEALPSVLMATDETAGHRDRQTSRAGSRCRRTRRRRCSTVCSARMASRSNPIVAAEVTPGTCWATFGTRRVVISVSASPERTRFTSSARLRPASVRERTTRTGLPRRRARRLRRRAR